MTSPTLVAQAVPHVLPACLNARLALFAMRRMGAHGLSDAPAANAILNGFGRNFRRPLILLRALMADVSGTATGRIAIAQCCCTRMTAAENALLTVLSRIETAPDTARLLLADLLGIRRVDGVLTSAAAVAGAFADAGRPITDQALLPRRLTRTHSSATNSTASKPTAAT